MACVACRSCFGGNLALAAYFKKMKKGYVADIEALSLENENFRKVLYTDEHCQLVLMSLHSNEEIGEEVHHVDQFLRVEKGSGTAVLGGISHNLSDGSVIIVPAGTKHNVTNNGSDSMKIYTLYMPPHHKDGIVHRTKSEAEADTTDKFEGKTTE